MTIPRSEDREHSTPPQSPALQGCDVSSTTLKRPIGADATVRSASLPQLTMKMPRSKVYRKTSLKASSQFLKHEIDAGGDGNGVTERNGVVRYMSVAAEKKQKRKNLMDRDVDAVAKCENKWNSDNIHITCNPMSTPYPYSTPAATTTTTATTVTSKTTTTTVESDEEPKSRSCGSFLPILSLIPHSVISFQYLSPKMKFSWWRNKIS